MKKRKSLALIWLGAVILSCITLLVSIETRIALPVATPTSEPTAVPEKFVASLRFYVSPTGDDNADGLTRQTPFQTPERAQQAVRAARHTDGDIVVMLMAGTYSVQTPLTFDASDGGLDGHTVIWTGENATLSGGIVLDGWADNGDGTFACHADASRSRDLFLGDRRATYALSKKLEAITVDETGFTVRSDELARVTDTTGLEIALKNEWTYSYITVDAIEHNTDGTLFVRMHQPAWSTYVSTQDTVGTELIPEQIDYACNSRYFLDEEGEWCYDAVSGNILVYAAQKPTEAVLATAEQLLILNGTAEAPVTNLRFDSLTFAHTTWTQTKSDGGFICIQANVYRKEGMNTDTKWNNDYWLDSLHAVYGCYTRSVSFTDNTFTHIGSGALHLGRSTQFASVTGNTFTDVGGNAVTLGGFNFFDHHPFAKNLPAILVTEGMKHISSDNAVTYNTITDCANVYLGGVGIAVGYTARTRVEYNTVSDMPYSGISFGWGWGFGYDELSDVYYTDADGKSLFCDNSVSYNHITEVMTYLHDGGGIYTLGRNDNSRIVGNYIDGVHNDYGGIYLDGGSVGFTVTGNVVANCYRNYILKGDYNYCEDNYTTVNTAVQPDLFMWDPLDPTDCHRSFRNNYRWDEAEVSRIKQNAGARKQQKRWL